jgi:hypothetical protein
MISRRTFILGTGVAAFAPLASPLLSNELVKSVDLVDTNSVDMIKQKYPFASTAKLKLAGWDDFLDSGKSESEPCQWVLVSSNWKIV